ncbi:CU044_2847 family protein [Kitasatospora sp. NPDC005748]|uniref:CU044_2847 family protein n=1 Tax=Kitasatospora sp. NPDC005748 TaxID=3157063 RepID=UPI0033D6CBB8
MGDVITVDLGGGALVHAEVTALEPATAPVPAPAAGTGTGAGGDAGVRDAAGRALAELPLRLDAVGGVLRDVGRWASDSVADAGPAMPDALEVEFGLKLAVKSGKLIGVVAEAGGEASFTVRMSWDTARVSAARAARRDVAHPGAGDGADGGQGGAGGADGGPDTGPPGAGAPAGPRVSDLR